MTIADLKRKMQIGKGIKLVYAYGLKEDNPRLNKIRYIVKTQTNGVYLNEDKNTKVGSWLDFPKASLFEITEKGFKIFSPIERDLTEEEKQIKENEPKDQKQEELDAISDGSQMFYRRKNYYKENGFEYLFGANSKEINGKYLTHNKGVDKIRDSSIKGELSLEYEFID